MKNLLKYCIYSTLIFAAIFSCEGPVGPIGPQGTQGSQGSQGDQGESGTANVIYSEWFSPTAWLTISFDGKTNEYFDKSAPDINAEILNSAVVMVYTSISGDNPANGIKALPVYLNLVDAHIYFGASDGSIRIWAYALNDDEAPGLRPEWFSFRYVIIPGGTLASGRIANVDLMDYEAVKAHYNIPD